MGHKDELVRQAQRVSKVGKDLLDRRDLWSLRGVRGLLRHQARLDTKRIEGSNKVAISMLFRECHHLSQVNAVVLGSCREIETAKDSCFRRGNGTQ